MQTSKISLLICAGAVCAAPFIGHAADTEEQARLRGLLRQSMNDAHATAPAESKPVSAETMIPPTAAVPMEVSQPIIPSQPRSDTDAKLRDALHQAMTGTTPTVPPAQDVVVVPPPPAQPETPVMTTAEPVAVVPAEPANVPAVESFQEIPAMSESPNDAKLQEALHQAMAERAAREAATGTGETESAAAATASPMEEPPMTTPAAPVTGTSPVSSPDVVIEPAPLGETRVIDNTPAVVIEQPVPPSVAAEMPEPMTNTLAVIPESMTNAVVETPMPGQVITETNATEAAQQVMQQTEAPVISHELSPENKQKLRELTAQYMADKISPEEYHMQRAKIVAAP